MGKAEKWQFKYEKNGEVKICYPQSKEQIEKNRAVCKKNGYKVLSIKKLYPFSTMKNQHNFDLIHNIVMNELYDIWHGNKSVSDEEYNQLEKARDRSEYFFCLPLPLAWLTWDEWKEANEMAQAAIFHRQEACIANGRPDLVTYC